MLLLVGFILVLGVDGLHLVFVLSGVQMSRQLSVKELAAALGVSVTYVYLMIKCGFPLHQVDRTASLSDAQDWLKSTHFRVVRGCGRVCGCE